MFLGGDDPYRCIRRHLGRHLGKRRIAEIAGHTGRGRGFYTGSQIQSLFEAQENNNNQQLNSANSGEVRQDPQYSRNEGSRSAADEEETLP